MALTVGIAIFFFSASASRSFSISATRPSISSAFKNYTNIRDDNINGQKTTTIFVYISGVQEYKYPGYKGINIRGTRVYPGYEGISGVRKYIRGTKVYPGYEGISGVRGYKYPGYEGISGVRRYIRGTRV